MSYVTRRIAKDLTIIEGIIAEILWNREKFWPLSENCRKEIEYAKESCTDEEVRNNIIKTHEKQIQDNEYASRQNEMKYESATESYNRIRSIYFPGIIGAIKLFIYKLF